MTATWDDEKIARLVKSGGLEGLAAYGLWWRILEIVASQMGPKTSNCSVTYDVSRWSVLLSLRGSHVRHWVEKLALTTLVTAEWTGSELTVTIPNLLKYRDEYTKKSRHSRSIEGEGDTEGDTEGEEEVESLGVAPRAPPPTRAEIDPPHPPKKSAVNGTRLAEESLPAAWLAWAMGEMNWDEFRVRKVWECFHDYWNGTTGAKARKADWFATWRNWCRREIDRAPPARSQYPKLNFVESVEQVMRERISQGRQPL